MRYLAGMEGQVTFMGIVPALRAEHRGHRSPVLGEPAPNPDCPVGCFTMATVRQNEDGSREVVWREEDDWRWRFRSMLSSLCREITAAAYQARYMQTWRWRLRARFGHRKVAWPR